MREQEAESIVYAFAGLLAEHDDFILDARLLPESKQRIYKAFDLEITRYETLKTTYPERFQRDGCDETLQMIKALRVRIADFQTIDAEDELLVAQVNSGPKIHQLQERLNDGLLQGQEREDVRSYVTRALQLYLKYNRRGMAEQGIT